MATHTPEIVRRKIDKVLVANRSEIAIRIFRTATEMGIRTVAVYAHEDRYALHRFKADEAYLIEGPGSPIKAYLNIAKIIEIAKRAGADAIHPGYGFLSENPALAAACQEAGILFVGPSAEILHKLGDKTYARAVAQKAGVPTLDGSQAVAAKDLDDVANKVGFPVILKASQGGGGRGMRVVTQPQDLHPAYDEASREAAAAFGCGDVFVERFVDQARHIEVQLLGDQHGQLVHLFERDCSVQRRHQKVVEIAPAPNLDPAVRDALCEAALKIGHAVGYFGAGTVEFLLDNRTGAFFFIEVNPRIQVEHTVTEEVTGIDIVRRQILIAEGAKLSDPELDLADQSVVRVSGFALQARVTTEDPANGFRPDFGRISHYRSASGMGIRLDAGSGFSGAMVVPFYDSLLVKVTARSRTFDRVVRKMNRSLREFRIRGVKTNIGFLLSLLEHPTFAQGLCTTRFIDQTPELFCLPIAKDRATRMLRFLANRIVNGNPELQGRPKLVRREPAPIPDLPNTAPPEGLRQKLLQLGPQGFAAWVRQHPKMLFCDTTFRDAHQSLLATRMRSYDLARIAPAYAHLASDLFSLEMWGGATFDVSMRFLHECPWQRLQVLRKHIPNICFQMLLRASNAVGYAHYPNNVVEAFVHKAAESGIDIFRVFDALNGTEQMQVAMRAVVQSGAVCQAAICYTGDILNPNESKFTLQYYLDIARRLVDQGAHMLAIKDMAGLCTPEAAATLTAALRDAVDVPVHLHTHDTAGIQAASVLQSAAVGLDVADGALAPMSGTTSQPNLNAMLAALAHGKRQSALDLNHMDALADYWRAVRSFYRPFEAEVLPATADLYAHQMPGGQYTNLLVQARALGLEDRWREIGKTYAAVDTMLGRIVKVTPTSKAVGDMALFMVGNQLTPEDVLNPSRSWAYPQSFQDLLAGRMGQNPGGFPSKLTQCVLGDETPLTEPQGASMPAVDFEETQKQAQKLAGDVHGELASEALSLALYPKVYGDFCAHRQQYGEVCHLPTPAFLTGLQEGEEIAAEIEAGKTLIVKYLAMGAANEAGEHTVFFELNGQPREVVMAGQHKDQAQASFAQGDASNPEHVISNIPGMIASIAVKQGDTVVKDQRLLSIEAMKMETTLLAPHDGTIEKVYVNPRQESQKGMLLMVVTQV